MASPRFPYLAPSEVKYIAVHCSASSPKVNANVALIRKWHRERGFLDIGYHYVITRSGEVQKGRPDDAMGAHIQGFNDCAIGICLAGGVDDKGNPEANFAEQQYAALAELIIDLRKKFPTAIVQGHRDFPNVAKACPSFDVRKWLKETVDHGA